MGGDRGTFSNVEMLGSAALSSLFQKYLLKLKFNRCSKMTPFRDDYFRDGELGSL